MTPLGLAYVATPYTLMPDLDRAFQQAARVAAHLAKSGLAIFAPIVHSHPLVRAGNLDHRDPAVYAALNEKMLKECSVLIVVQMEGWHESQSVKEEIAYFESMHKPIFDCDPVTLVMKRRG
jgi:hypothetical protein